MRSNFLLIANRTAGLASSTLLESTLQHLHAAGARVHEVTPDCSEDARAEARKAAQSGTYDAIVAAGGDGTIRQVAGGLIGSGTPLGIIPAGTANVLAVEIGLAVRANAVADTLLGGRCIRVCVARANGEPFLLMAGAGLDARVLSTLDQRLKSRMGKAAYAAPLFEALTGPIDNLSVSIEGRRCDASWIILANASHYAGKFLLAPRTGIETPELQAIVFKARNRATLMSQIMSLALGRLSERSVRDGDVEMTPCSRAVITAVQPVPTQLDGDLFGTTPLEVQAGTDALQLLVPART